MRLSINIPDDAWEFTGIPGRLHLPNITPDGQDDDGITINGVGYHVEAIRVHGGRYGELQYESDSENEEMFEALHSIDHDGPKATVTIRGEEYVIVVFPFCK